MENNVNKDVKVTSDTNAVPRKKVPFWAFLVFGCLGVFVVSGVIFSIAGKVIFSGFGKTLIQKGIEEKTGLKVNTDNGEENIKYTDTKTGTEVNFGSQKIPDGFPKDFPIYPGAKPSGSLSGSKQIEDKGFWLMLATPDQLSKVEKFYADNLVQKGWNGKESLRMGNSVTWTVAKGNFDGTVVVNQEKEENETSIMIMLGSKKESLPEETPQNE